MDKRLTILDIARLSGVGKSTVSRVLNQDPKVKPETRERIEAIIQAQGFVPSKSARAMRTNSNRLVGILVSRLDSASENRAVRGMLETLYARGYDAMLMESKFSSTLTSEHLELLERRGVDGVILFAFSGLDLATLHPWQEKLVLVAREQPGFASVCYDDAGAITLVMQHLYLQGLRHIAFLGVKQEDVTTGARRLAAYQQFCDLHGLSSVSAVGDLDYQSGFQLAAELITADTQALVCATDTLALGAAKYLQQQGRHDVSLTGVGNNELLHFLFPQVLSVDLGYKSAGALAANQLLDQIEQAAPAVAHIAPATMTARMS